MIIYITGTLISMLLAYISTHIGYSSQINVTLKKIYAKVFAFLSFIPLTAIMAFRYDVGTDFLSYRRIFIFGWTVDETGYNWLNSVLRSVSSNSQILFIVTAIIICSGYYIAIYRESVIPEYSILLFVIVKDYFISMNVVRQYIAISILLFAIPYIKNKNHLKTAVFIIAAMLFHRSAIIIAALVVLYNLEIKPVIGVGITVGTYIFSTVIKNVMFPILLKYGLYSKYFVSDRYGNAEQVFNWQYMLITVGPFIILCYIYNKVAKNKNLKLLYSGVLLNMIIMSMSSALPTIIGRITWYMNAFIVLYLPEATRAINSKRVRIFVDIVIIVLYTIVAVRNITGGAQNVLPYQTFWSH